MNRIPSPIQQKQIKERLNGILADKLLNTPISRTTPMLVRIMADLMKIHKDLFDKIDEYYKMVEIKQGEKGESIKGDKGEDGYTPSKEELLELILPLIPEVKHGETPSEEYLLSLIQSVMPEIKHGETPNDEKLLSLMRPLIPVIESKDIVITDEHLEKIASKVSSKMKPIKHEKEEVDIDNLLNLISKRPKGKRLNLDFIDGLDQTIQSLSSQVTKKGYLHGGGDTVLAGGGVTITKNANGNKIISAAGFQILTATEIPNGVLTIFTFPSATAKPSFIISDNVMMRATTSKGTINWTWNAGTKQAVLTIPPSDDIAVVV